MSADSDTALRALQQYIQLEGAARRAQTPEVRDQIRDRMQELRATVARYLRIPYSPQPYDRPESRKAGHPILKDADE